MFEEFAKCKVRSEDEVRSKLIVPLTEALGYKPTIVVLDMVRDELKRNDDALTSWMFSKRKIQIINHNSKDTIEIYQKIMKYIVECGFYNNNGIRSQSEGTIADPWLIATAASNKCILVTIEKQVSNLSKKNPTNKLRIPDVAKAFGVEVIDVFEMMRRLGIVIQSSKTLVFDPVCFLEV